MTSWFLGIHVFMLWYLYGSTLWYLWFDFMEGFLRKGSCWVPRGRSIYIYIYIYICDKIGRALAPDPEAEPPGQV